MVDTLPDKRFDGNADDMAHGYGGDEALHRAIATLPAGQKIAMQLVKLREMSLTEAAAASGMSTAALKTAVHRGIAALRSRLENAVG